VFCLDLHLQLRKEPKSATPHGAPPPSLTFNYGQTVKLKGPLMLITVGHPSLIFVNKAEAYLSVAPFRTPLCSVTKYKSLSHSKEPDIKCVAKEKVHQGSGV